MCVDSLNVMLVDDDPSVLFLHKRAVKKLSLPIDISEVRSGIAAVDSLQRLYSENKSAPDYIFLDLDMPHLNGWEFLKKYDEFPEEWRNETTIYIVSTTVDPVEIHRAESYDAVQGFIPKLLTANKLRLLLNLNGEDT